MGLEHTLEITWGLVMVTGMTSLSSQRTDLLVSSNLGPIARIHRTVSWDSVLG